MDVYIYPSHADEPLSFEASWQAVYIGHVESQGGAHPQGMQFRPPSTAKYPGDNEGYWAVFREVTNLREVTEDARTRLADFAGYGKPKTYKRAFIPEGPLLVEHP